MYTETHARARTHTHIHIACSHAIFGRKKEINPFVT